MAGDVSINIKTILGSLAIIAFLILLFGIGYKYSGSSFKIPDNVFIGAAVILGFIISIGTYAITDLGLIPSLTLGYIPAFIMLGLITYVGWILLLIDLLILLITIIVHYSEGY